MTFVDGIQTQLWQAAGNPTTIALTALRVAIVFVVVLGLLKVSGKRVLGQFTPFDLVALLLISNVVQNAMIGPDTKNESQRRGESASAEFSHTTPYPSKLSTQSAKSIIGVVKNRRSNSLISLAPSDLKSAKYPAGIIEQVGERHAAEKLWIGVEEAA